MGSSSQ
jgi:hypothetical protein